MSLIQQSSGKRRAQLPASLRPARRPRSVRQLYAQLLVAFQAQDDMDAYLIRDLADAEWDILRATRHKEQYVEAEERASLLKFLNRVHGRERGEVLFRNFGLSNPEQVQEVHSLLKQYGLTLKTVRFFENQGPLAAVQAFNEHLELCMQRRDLALQRLKDWRYRRPEFLAVDAAPGVPALGGPA